MTAPAISAPVKAAITAWPDTGRAHGLRLRELIYETARDAGSDPVEETLKWGQPSFSNGKSGTPLRLGYQADAVNPVRLYVHCSTDLIDQCRSRFDNLTYEKNRAICLSDADPLPEGPLRACIALALTYHINKKASHG